MTVSASTRTPPSPPRVETTRVRPRRHGDSTDGRARWKRDDPPMRVKTPATYGRGRPHRTMPEQGCRFEAAHNHRPDCSVPRRTAGEVARLRTDGGRSIITLPDAQGTHPRTAPTSERIPLENVRARRATRSPEWVPCASVTWASCRGWSIQFMVSSKMSSMVRVSSGLSVASPTGRGVGGR